MKTLVLLLISISSFAQYRDGEHLRTSIENLVAGSKLSRLQSYEADSFTDKAMDAFEQNGEEGLDSFIECESDDWYSSIDIYINAYREQIVEDIKADKNAGFRSPKVKKVSVCYAWYDDVEMIIVFSYYR